MDAPDAEVGHAPLTAEAPPLTAHAPDAVYPVTAVEAPQVTARVLVTDVVRLVAAAASFQETVGVPLSGAAEVADR